MKKVFTQALTLLILGLLIFNSTNAQESQKKDKPVKLKHWMTPEEAKLKHLIGNDKQVTDPPDGPVTNIAEFDKMQSVLIRYQFGISYDVIAEMSQECMVTTIVPDTNQQNYVTNQYNNQGVNLDNCDFIIASSNSYWTRDYGPWFIIDGNDELGIVDFTYNRPRPYDNAIPAKVASDFGFNLFEMDIETAGGNYMTDGMGQSASSDLIWDENPGYTQQEIDEIFQDYLGIETYHVLDDPNNTYIDHIDCWGKYLDVDKVLIRSVPESHAQYDEIEATAAYFESQNSSFGLPYQVYRVYTPNDEPYTNSLILNKRVFVPITNSQWDDEALAAYEEAMPGYEVLGFTGSWESTDALHCRTKGIADQNMVHIAHMPLHGEQPVQTSYDLEATIKTFSGADLNSDSVLIYYRVNGAEWMTEDLTNTSGHTWSGTISELSQGNQVDYYLFAADQDGNRVSHPFIGAPDPHVFFAGEQAFAQIGITPNEINASAPTGQTATEMLEICNTGELDLNFSITANTAVYGEISMDVPDSPAASSWDYSTWDEENWVEFDVTDTGTLAGLQVEFDWDTDSWPEEGSFHLMSPEGTEATIASGSPIGTYTVDMTAFNGEDMNGTWRMWIEDTYGDGGHQATNIGISFTYVISLVEWLVAGPASGTVAPGDCLDVQVICDASELETGTHEGLLMIESNDPDYPEMPVYVTFEVTEPGQLAMTPDTLWFIDEQTIVNGLTATIQNPSNVDVTISEIQQDGGMEFFWFVDNMSQTLPHTLAPAEEMTFHVFIALPVDEGFVNMAYDSVQIVSDAGDYYETIALDLDLISSVNEVEKSTIRVYPSPFVNKLTIDLSNFDQEVENILITDLAGRVVKQFNSSEINPDHISWNTNDTEIPVNEGVYLIQVHFGQKVEVFKIVKMK